MENQYQGFISGARPSSWKSWVQSTLRSRGFRYGCQSSSSQRQLSWEEKKDHSLELWEEHLKDQIIALDKALKCLGEPLLSVGHWLETSRAKDVLGTAMAFVGEGFRHSCGWVGSGDFEKDVGRAVLGRRLALLGPVGQCAPAHNVKRLERPREVWAARRASFSSFIKKEACGFERRVVQPLSLCGNAQGVRADWSAPFGNQKVKLGPVVVNLMFL